MKSKKLSNLTDKDVLAFDISTNDGLIILSKGTLLNKDYIEKLNDFGINEVFIEDPNSTVIETKKPSNVHEARESILQNYCAIFCETAKNNGITKEKLDESVSNIIYSVISKIEDNTLDILYSANPFFCHYTHALNTASLAVFLGTKMSLNDKEIRELATSALLHDIGMYKLPQDILEKGGNLNEGDVNIVKEHSLHGYETSRAIKDISETCRKAILYHHERFDGLGYPEKISGKEIPLYSRIIAVADIFCSLTTKTRVHPGYSHIDVYEFILASSGGYFDPEIVEVFQKHFVIYPIGTKIELNNGRKGIVLSQNPGFPDRPNLKITHNDNGIEILPMKVSLLRRTNLKIVKILT
ncbi:HD-GYP domain-containing protein [Clostridium cylindrosporum]|uniref:HD-GYP domain-containing protein n=1 Tax=Clostridium cylindrosporum DSM 605 TaxID=1121307 RepID=A0A0J8DGP1_CLOCY|nr:HD-GYP domain-containing protein [Clostridium cylindrosporum]KMT23358.1 HD-GYP domain-containing protein [Clostridium cylindrosporum DSM 605]